LIVSEELTLNDSLPQPNSGWRATFVPVVSRLRFTEIKHQSIVRGIGLSLAVGVLSGFGWRYSLQNIDATYQGKTANEWYHSIDMAHLGLRNPAGVNRAAFKAIKALKGDTVPLLLHELRMDDLPYHYELFLWLKKMSRGHIKSDSESVEQVWLGFRALGVDARDAVPELIEMSRDAGPNGMSTFILNQIDSDAVVKAGLW
jgi:hypothetical protein